MDSYDFKVAKEISKYEQERLKPKSTSNLTKSRSKDKILLKNKVFEKYEQLCSYIGPRNPSVKKQSVLIVILVYSDVYKVEDFNGNTHLFSKNDLLIFPPNDSKIYSKTFIKKVIPKNYFYNFLEQRYYYIDNGINPYPDNVNFKRVIEI